MMNLVLKLKKVIKLQSFYRDSLQNIKKEMGFLVNVIYCLVEKENTVFFEQSEVRGPDLLSRQSYKYENELIYETESEI